MKTTLRKLNIGCGRKVMADFINIDTDESVKPDIIHNFNQPFPFGKIFKSERLGDISIENGQIDYIIADNVLEHVQDLWTAMRTCFDALVDGGSFHIIVPYDLSFGAWQDPTHVRAFNERSWIYYGSWCPWTEGCFDTTEMNFGFSPFGASLVGKGTPLDEVLRLPRAVHDMRVTLRKRLHQQPS